MKFFNTTLGISMLPDGEFTVITLTDGEATKYLAGDIENVANPTHANSLQAISQKLGVNVLVAKGGRVFLGAGDECLIAQVTGIPRETREYSDEEITKAEFVFRLIKVKGGE